MSVQHTIQDVQKFVAKALKLGKYNPATGAGYSAALKLIEKGIQQDEPNTIEYVSEHVMEIYTRQNDLPLSPQSLSTYAGRVKTVISDYKAYGVDPTKIYSWNKNQRLKSIKKIESKESFESKGTTENSDQSNEDVTIGNTVKVGNVVLHSVRWRLRPSLTISIQLPEDLNIDDVAKLKDLLDIELKYNH